MRVLLFHPSRLPPPDYGGIERVVLWLARGLRDRGHEVWVAAYPGSVLPPGVRLLEISRADSAPERLASRLPRGIELVHFMAPPGAEVERKFPCPWLLTVHGNGRPGERFPLNSVFLSRDHADRHGARVFVHNGADPDEIEFAPERKGPEWVFLSRTAWRVKNVVGAARIARRAGVPLAVAGGHRRWATRLATALTPGQRWVGPVGGEAKARLLGAARGLLFPVLWSEPFGLVVVEAMLAGAPVLASRIGSLPELVSAESGRLLLAPRDAESEAAWIEALREADARRWDPAGVRAHAMRHFHLEKMAAGYEDVYRRVLAGERLHSEAPRAAGTAGVGELGGGAA